jgi:DNA polymerase V
MSPTKKIFALVDCNTFYASCEKVFRPDLTDRPVVVLSNNDGCSIAISKEAKALGIPFAEPYFKIKNLLKEKGVHVFSANFELYGDLSKRVMQTLAHFSDEIEYYSIDEAFLILSSPENALSDARVIRETVKKWTGIPVSIGIAPTKTLAKLAADYAKKSASGIFQMDETNRELILRQTPVQAIWGIGRRLSRRYEENNIYHADQLARSEEKWLLQKFSLPGLRTAKELKGIPCIHRDDLGSARKGILCSRSFGRSVTSLLELKEAIAVYVSQAAVKLRAQKTLAQHLYVFIDAPSKNEQVGYSKSLGIKLMSATDDTLELIREAHDLLEKIYEPNYFYKRAGIQLFGMVEKTQKQLTLFESEVTQQKNNLVMQALDHLNKKYRKELLFVGAGGIDRPWRAQRNLKSPAYTTRWEELPLAKV